MKRVNPVGRAQSRNRLVNEMRVQIHQEGVGASWIEHSRKVQRLVVLATCNAATRLEAEDLFEALKVLSLDLVQA
eukprot:CAMPEP_0170477674 /NCGR_PEP_ID=MMETSP0123-20130129/18874_1 /TAXON_ID=182087 /ORGANISM="Favella ehrenbergii, Strain Fehren 1" /LENGTH=74 /DNA_ID=CAMNT_0010749519 /DNA_START=663 /DNA_END=887 /DNA_ORIENTATION=-